MNKVIAAFKKIRLNQILTTFLVGILLFVSTACGDARVQAKTPGDSGVQVKPRQEAPAGKLAVPGKKNPRPEVPETAETNTFQGDNTMNEFSDIQPGTKGVEAANQKAKALIDNAERNVIDQSGDLGENTKRTLDKKGENVEDLGKNLKRSAEDTQNKAKGTAENATQGIKQGTENLKDSTQGATRDLTKGAERAAENAKDSTRQAARGTQRNLEKAGEAIDNTVD